MKHLFILLTFLLSLHIYSQGFIDCGTVETGKAIIYSPAKLNQSKFSNNNTKYTFNVKVHYVEHTSGVGIVFDDEEKEENTLAVVGILNLYFNQQQIFFKYDGYDTVEDDALYELTSSGFSQFENYIDSQRIDIFINYSINVNANAHGICITKLVSDVITDKVVFITWNNIPYLINSAPTPFELSYFTLVHEVGHYFGLYHPHQRWTNDNNELVAFSDANQDCDYLEENLDGSEAYILGDFLADTAPDRVQGIYNFSYNENNCTIEHSNASSHCGNTINFNVFNPSMENIMAYYRKCREFFSGEQYYRMRAFIDDYTNTPSGFLYDSLIDEEKLYEPYKYESIVNNDDDEILLRSGLSFSISQNTPVQHRYFFQKGFDYEIYNCFIDPQTGETTTFDIDQTYQVHETPIVDMQGHSMYISQIGESGDCWPFFEGISRKVIGGNLLTHYQNSYTFQVLDSTQINSVDFLENMPTGIHTININLDSGETSQKTILKQ